MKGNRTYGKWDVRLLPEEEKFVFPAVALIGSIVLASLILIAGMAIGHFKAVSNSNDWTQGFNECQSLYDGGQK